MNKKIRVGITQGDTNGIGTEVILRMLEDPRLSDLCTIVLYGSAKVAAFYRKAAELPPVQLVRVDSADQAKDGQYNIINVVGEDLRIEPGQPTADAGAAALAALERATDDLRQGLIDVLVTAPIDKHTIQSDSFAFPGHTEYLEARLGDEDSRALMLMCTDTLRVALATAHTPLRSVPEAITKELILDRLEQFNKSLKRDFAIPTPRIAVLSLNPHAGEEGLLGDEEINAIRPAIEEARDRRILAFGPYASDGFFGNGNYSAFDGVLAMYHDQGLTAFKTIAMDEGVNFTAGLPFVRTSPDHGTGFDIAAKGKARPDSLRAALYMALDIYRNRLTHDEIFSRPLQIENRGTKEKSEQ